MYYLRFVRKYIYIVYLQIKAGDIARYDIMMSKKEYVRRIVIICATKGCIICNLYSMFAHK